MLMRPQAFTVHAGPWTRAIAGFFCVGWGPRAGRVDRAPVNQGPPLQVLGSRGGAQAIGRAATRGEPIWQDECSGQGREANIGENPPQENASKAPPLQGTSQSQGSPQAWFAKGQAALQSGDLNAADAAFRKVIVLDPRSGAAYSNLGVIAMRRKEWDQAITLLRKAETLEPKMSGIRLNIGLAEYRRGNYAAAIAPLASFLREQPESEQARYLLGMCQVFTKHYDEGIKILQPLWSSRSSDVLYLYLMDIAAVESKKKELDEKILKQMIAVGGGTPEFHLILGKAYLKRDEVPQATA